MVHLPSITPSIPIGPGSQIRSSMASGSVQLLQDPMIKNPLRHRSQEGLREGSLSGSGRPSEETSAPSMCVCFF